MADGKPLSADELKLENREIRDGAAQLRNALQIDLQGISDSDQFKSRRIAAIADDISALNRIVPEKIQANLQKLRKMGVDPYSPPDYHNISGGESRLQSDLPKVKAELAQAVIDRVDDTLMLASATSAHTLGSQIEMINIQDASHQEMHKLAPPVVPADARKGGRGADKPK